MNCENIQQSSNNAVITQTDKGKGKEINNPVIEISDNGIPVKDTNEKKPHKGRGRPKGSVNVKKEVKVTKIKGIDTPGKYNPWNMVDAQSKDGLTSEERLINFLLDDGGLNMRKYLGSVAVFNKDGVTKGKPGESKAVIHNRIVASFIEQGVNYRTSETIKSKIDGLLKAYRKAHAKDSQSGEGAMGDSSESGKTEFES